MLDFALVEDEDTGDRFLVYRAKDGVRADLRVEGETFWATQAQMAMMFGVDQSGISRHVSNIFAEGELSEEFAMQKMHSSKGGNLYNLNMLISVGYRVSGPMGTMFRIWATDKLFQYLNKGFVIDERRLKNPDGLPDHFEELLETIRDIRSSESRMWTRILELASFCSDYNKDDAAQHVTFFAEIAEARNNLWVRLPTEISPRTLVTFLKARPCHVNRGVCRLLSLHRALKWAGRIGRSEAAGPFARRPRRNGNGCLSLAEGCEGTILHPVSVRQVGACLLSLPVTPVALTDTLDH